ncbi:CBS domain-containing protein [Striga asiatica]|uniref:CBS domain-containing protein n=1 Tax=Striga asiatica TaxID=4170 RepID=A0A5A7RIW1_STRAF|nr:CBS domain-containing protein [Striga asiatica]
MKLKKKKIPKVVVLMFFTCAQPDLGFNLIAVIGGICTPSLISGASFIRQENNNRLGSVSYQYRSVLHTTQNVPFSNITNENLGLSSFIDLNNDDVNDVLLLSPDSIFKQPQVIDSHAEILNDRAAAEVPLTTVKRNRGRPKKILGNTSAQTDLEKITGTPNTTISSEIFDHCADDQVTVTTLKRKRGRHKKIIRNTSTPTGVDLLDQVPPTNQKKKPGRPKQVLASTSTRSSWL